MRVYRVEHPIDRLGPWRSEHRTTAELSYHEGHHPSDGPSVLTDCFGNWDDRSMYGRVCACRSLQQLRLWFRAGHVLDFAGDGFVLAEYEAHDDTPKGSWQCAPKRADMVHRADRPVTDLYAVVPC
jgi:hypothetical protein